MHFKAEEESSGRLHSLDREDHLHLEMMPGPLQSSAGQSKPRILLGRQSPLLVELSAGSLGKTSGERRAWESLGGDG